MADVPFGSLIVYCIHTVAPAHLMKDKTPMGVEETDSVSTTCTDTYKPSDDISATINLSTPMTPGNFIQ